MPLQTNVAKDLLTRVTTTTEIEVVLNEDDEYSS